MRIAALQLVGGLLLKLVYVPSEDNPADAPSRGIVRRWRARKGCTAKTKRQVATETAKRSAAYIKGAEGRRATRTIKRIDSRLSAMRREYKRTTGLDYPASGPYHNI